LASGGRDGCIRVWQGEAASGEEDTVEPPQLRNTLQCCAVQSGPSQQRIWFALPPAANKM
jgi:hypothetical protein